MTTETVVKHTKCRLCKSENLSKLFSLGDQYVNDFVPKERVGEGVKAPLSLVMCTNCSLIQLEHTAPQELLYSRFYWYRSGVTDTMRKGLADIAAAVVREVDLQPTDVVLDIGANDGTLLSNFPENGCIRVGCEPAQNLTEQLEAVTPFVIDDFWSLDAYKAAADKYDFSGKAKVVTAIGMFYDLEEPNKFVKDIADCLADDGVFVAQLMSLAPMIEKNDLGNVCHEHLEFYSSESLKYLFETNGLEIYKTENNAINGGSIRLFARKFQDGSIDLVDNIGMEEMLAFRDRINHNRDLCVDFIKAEVAKGKKVYVYGASTKGNVILQYYDLDTDLIVAAAERSPEKWGKYTIGSWIPIISEEQARSENPDYFLILPWAFTDEFLVRESEWREKGGKFIVPLPDFRVV